jgi:parallel beta-helix repeat protein
VCKATGFSRDGHELTAAQIGGNVTGPLDATGCDIGVYYAPGETGAVNEADISGARYYGVVANAAAVDVTNSKIHDIGDNPLRGMQRGVGVFYTTLNQDSTSTGTAATGTVSGNFVTTYQKGGMVVNGPGASVTISGNTVTGEGPVDYIAQNGIQLGRGATGTISDNTVTGNAYKGSAPASSSGILVFGGGSYGALTTGVSVTHNTLTGNDLGVYVYNTDPSGSKPPTTKTKNSVVNNTISNSQTTNVSGNGSPNGYQAGIVDYGNRDNIVNNKISGNGYNQTHAPTTGSFYGQFDVDEQNAHFNNNG